MWLLTGLLIFTNQIWASPGVELLPKLNIKNSEISVSGISSGAAMATQLVIAYPELFKAVGVFAGPVWGCANGNPERAQEICMKAPQAVKVDELWQEIERGKNNFYGNPELLKNSKVYIWHGSKDSKVNPLQARLQSEFWQKVISPSQLRVNINLAFEHVFPTLDKGRSCFVAASPFIGKCGFDATKEIFDFFFGYKTVAAKKPKPQSLKIFKQDTYLEANSQMGKEGFLYVPQQCAEGKECYLHIALHGCMQVPEFIDRQFAEWTGYKEVADLFDVVVLFPSASSFRENPYGCWDWWGYTGAEYLKRQSPQMKSILNMIRALAGS